MNDVDAVVTRWDVRYGPEEWQCEPVPHFCRVWDEGGGCYGTNPDHGMSWDEAREEVAEFYQRLSDEWAIKEEADYWG